MPELPEVEACRSLVEKYCLGQQITTVCCIEQGGGPRDSLFDDIVHEGGISMPFETAMQGRILKSVERKGKQLWITLEESEANVLFHFGMTGSFVIRNKEKFTYKSFKIDDEGDDGARIWPPRFTKMEIIFANGIQLAFCDPRRLGRIRIRHGDPTKSEPISILAPDPVLDGIEIATFTSVLNKASCPIKALLLDQNKAVCGIGNWVADEVLFRAGIHPSTPANSINKKGISALATSITTVLQTAIDCNNKRETFPVDWLFHYRWGGKNQTGPNTPTMPNGRQISFLTVGGRTSAFVSALQPRYGPYNKFEQELDGEGDTAGGADATLVAAEEGTKGKKGTKRKVTKAAEPATAARKKGKK